MRSLSQEESFHFPQHKQMSSFPSGTMEVLCVLSKILYFSNLFYKLNSSFVLLLHSYRLFDNSNLCCGLIGYREEDLLFWTSEAISSPWNHQSIVCTYPDRVFGFQRVCEWKKLSQHSLWLASLSLFFAADLQTERIQLLIGWCDRDRENWTQRLVSGLNMIPTIKVHSMLIWKL